eukprot:Cvel_8715.t1-p1 / transcript=Cvel_8715.t1 / gene=Cvel_8715 / organism=Chromera_velia_CCMP2878 / gene_product=ABC transporter C family member 1, putative / transcript_product=ABC transporter C family member 1, putative / location=Cvel_scaffold487:25-17734(-) / protein_length=3199 / sequence_SO=supercontig / SO=protein_coding / is_pseudo=false
MLTSAWRGLRGFLFLWVNSLLRVGRRQQSVEWEDVEREIFTPFPYLWEPEAAPRIAETFIHHLNIEVAKIYPAYESAKSSKEKRKKSKKRAEVTTFPRLSEIPELNRSQPSLLRALHRSVLPPLYWLGFLRLIEVLCMIATPSLLNRLVTFVEKGDWKQITGAYYGLGLMAISFVGAFVSVHFQFGLRKVGMRVRAALISAIFVRTLQRGALVGEIPVASSSGGSASGGGRGVSEEGAAETGGPNAEGVRRMRAYGGRGAAAPLSVPPSISAPAISYPPVYSSSGGRRGEGDTVSITVSLSPTSPQSEQNQVLSRQYGHATQEGGAGTGREAACTPNGASPLTDTHTQSGLGASASASAWALPMSVSAASPSPRHGPAAAVVGGGAGGAPRVGAPAPTRASSKCFSSGEVNNFMSVDTEKIQQATLQAHECWATPLMLFASILQLYMQVRTSFIPCMAVVAILLSLQSLITLRIGHLQRRMMTFRDGRLRACKECFQNIRTVKMLAWEAFLYSRVVSVRKQELLRLRAKKYMHALGTYLYFCTPMLVKVATLTTLVVRGERLSVGGVFAALTLIDRVLWSMNSLPTLLNELVAAHVSYRRVSRFLLPLSPPKLPQSRVAAFLNKLKTVQLPFLPGEKERDREKEKGGRGQGASTGTVGGSAGGSASRLQKKGEGCGERTSGVSGGSGEDFRGDPSPPLTGAESSGERPRPGCSHNSECEGQEQAAGGASISGSFETAGTGGRERHHPAQAVSGVRVSLLSPDTVDPSGCPREGRRERERERIRDGHGSRRSTSSRVWLPDHRSNSSSLPLTAGSQSHSHSQSPPVKGRSLNYSKLRSKSKEYERDSTGGARAGMRIRSFTAHSGDSSGLSRRTASGSPPFGERERGIDKTSSSRRERGTVGWLGLLLWPFSFSSSRAAPSSPTIPERGQSASPRAGHGSGSGEGGRGKEGGGRRPTSSRRRAASKEVHHSHRGERERDRTDSTAHHEALGLLCDSVAPSESALSGGSSDDSFCSRTRGLSSVGQPERERMGTVAGGNCGDHGEGEKEEGEGSPLEAVHHQLGDSLNPRRPSGVFVGAPLEPVVEQVSDSESGNSSSSDFEGLDFEGEEGAGPVPPLVEFESADFSWNATGEGSEYVSVACRRPGDFRRLGAVSCSVQHPPAAETAAATGDLLSCSTYSAAGYGPAGSTSSTTVRGFWKSSTGLEGGSRPLHISASSGSVSSFAFLCGGPGGDRDPRSISARSHSHVRTRSTERSGETMGGALWGKGGGSRGRGGGLWRGATVLRGISMKVCEGELFVVVGPSGAGKTSLLAAVLGELKLVGGRAKVRLPPAPLPAGVGRAELISEAFESSLATAPLGYAAQSPWIFQGTIRENILFGRAFDEEAFQMTVRACAMVPDLEKLPRRDLQEIEAGGHSLSGGQKSRLALARCVYAAALHRAAAERAGLSVDDPSARSLPTAAGYRSLFVIDDPFSSLDAVTIEQVWSNVFKKGGLLANCTVILATHAVGKFLSDSRITRIIGLDGGECVLTGGYREALAARILGPGVGGVGGDSVTRVIERMMSLEEERQRRKGEVKVPLIMWGDAPPPAAASSAPGRGPAGGVGEDNLMGGRVEAARRPDRDGKFRSPLEAASDEDEVGDLMKKAALGSGPSPSGDAIATQGGQGQSGSLGTLRRQTGGRLALSTEVRGGASAAVEETGGEGEASRCPPRAEEGQRQGWGTWALSWIGLGWVGSRSSSSSSKLEGAKGRAAAEVAVTDVKSQKDVSLVQSQNRLQGNLVGVGEGGGGDMMKSSSGVFSKLGGLKSTRSVGGLAGLQGSSSFGSLFFFGARREKTKGGDADKDAEGAGVLMEPETRRSGSVGREVWLWYLRAMNIRVVWLTLISSLLAAYSNSLCDFWVKSWTAMEVPTNPISRWAFGWFEDRGLEQEFFLLGYWILVLFSAGAAVMSIFGFANCGVTAALHIHDRVLHSVLRAPPLWFDRNHVGRILNRFSEDQFAVDEMIPTALQAVVVGFVALLGKLAVLFVSLPSVLLLWWGLMMTVLLWSYSACAALYRTTIRELKRLETTNKSPIYGLFSDALTGTATIRSFKVDAVFLTKGLDLLERYQQIVYAGFGVHAWLQLRLQLLGAVLSAVMVLGALLPCYLVPQIFGEDNLVLEEDFQKRAESASSIFGWTTLVNFWRRLNEWTSDKCAKEGLSGLGRGAFAATVGLGLYSVLPLNRFFSIMLTQLIRSEVLMVSGERLRDYTEVEAEDASRDLDTGVARQMTREDRQRLKRNLEEGIGQSASARVLAPEGFEDEGADWEASSVTGMGGYHGTRREVDSQVGSVVAISPWPSAGRVEFSHVTVEYKPGAPPALRNLSFLIHPGECIGIVGRTGAGKSSIFMALLRMVGYEGTIRIDGVDIKRLPLQDLRARLAVVPQNPCLFTGTIRSNLDPEGRFPDGPIWSALEKCGMADFVRGLPKGLMTTITPDEDTVSADFRGSRKGTGRSSRRRDSFPQPPGTPAAPPRPPHPMDPVPVTPSADSSVAPRQQMAAAAAASLVGPLPSPDSSSSSQPERRREAEPGGPSAAAFGDVSQDLPVAQSASGSASVSIHLSLRDRKTSYTEGEQAEGEGERPSLASQFDQQQGQQQEQKTKEKESSPKSTPPFLSPQGSPVLSPQSSPLHDENETKRDPMLPDRAGPVPAVSTVPRAGGLETPKFELQIPPLAAESSCRSEPSTFEEGRRPPLTLDRDRERERSTSVVSKSSSIEVAVDGHPCVHTHTPLHTNPPSDALASQEASAGVDAFQQLTSVQPATSSLLNPSADNAQSQGEKEKNDSDEAAGAQLSLFSAAGGAVSVSVPPTVNVGGMQMGMDPIAEHDETFHSPTSSVSPRGEGEPGARRGSVLFPAEGEGEKEKEKSAAGVIEGAQKEKEGPTDAGDSPPPDLSADPMQDGLSSAARLRAQSTPAPLPEASSPLPGVGGGAGASSSTMIGARSRGISADTAASTTSVAAPGSSPSSGIMAPPQSRGGFLCAKRNRNRGAPGPLAAKLQSSGAAGSVKLPPPGGTAVSGRRPPRSVSSGNLVGVLNPHLTPRGLSPPGSSVDFRGLPLGPSMGGGGAGSLRGEGGTSRRGFLKGGGTGASSSSSGSASVERLSAGQRQLLCFCRALLRDAKVIILDEASSSVDLAVEDSVIMRALQSELSGRTVLMITHRLRAVVNHASRV